MEFFIFKTERCNIRATLKMVYLKVKENWSERAGFSRASSGGGDWWQVSNADKNFENRKVDLNFYINVNTYNVL